MSAWISHSSPPSEPASTWRMWIERFSVRERCPSVARSSSGVREAGSPAISAARCRLAVSYSGTNANRRDSAATQRPQSTQRPRSSVTRPSATAIAPVGQSCSSWGVPPALSRSSTRPRKPSGAGSVRRGVASRDGAGMKAACDPFEHARYLSAPAGVRPKLCSMKEKSVRTSPRNEEAKSGQLRSEGELIRTVLRRPASTSTQ